MSDFHFETAIEDLRQKDPGGKEMAIYANLVGKHADNLLAESNEQTGVHEALTDFDYEKALYLVSLLKPGEDYDPSSLAFEMPSRKDLESFEDELEQKISSNTLKADTGVELER